MLAKVGNQASSVADAQQRKALLSLVKELDKARSLVKMLPEAKPESLTMPQVQKDLALEACKRYADSINEALSQKGNIFSKSQKEGMLANRATALVARAELGKIRNQ